jgi:Carboxypeptidase regulatory-like domain
VELSVRDMSDSTVRATATARVTIVQQANSAEPMHRVASSLRLRAADKSAGVSPYELMGSGALRDGGTEQLSFVFRGSPGKSSQFGDQDEYRVALKGTNYLARAGDAFYRMSELTSSGQAGFGAGLDVAQGALGAGAFSQRFRFQQGSPTEHGGYVSARGEDMFGTPQVVVSALTRAGSLYDGKVVSTSASITPIGNTVVDVELAGSSAAKGSGAANLVRVSGGDSLRYDIGHLFGSTNFAGNMRGAQHDYASVSLRTANAMRYSLSGGLHQSNSITLGLATPQTYRSLTAAAELSSKYAVQLSSVSRGTTFGDARHVDSQNGLLARTEQTLGDMRLWGGIGAGVSTSSTDGRQLYHELNAGMSTTVGTNSYSVYGETSQNMTVTRGAGHLLTMGADARVQVGAGLYATVNGFGTSVLSTGERYSQVDAGLSQHLPSGSSVSLKVRLAGASNVQGRQIAFVEYATPLQMPVGRTRSVGRVRGRVVDEETGRGMAGTLVRLGPQAAITDADGRVTFAGLPAGEYRLTIAQQKSQGAQVFSGNNKVIVDSTNHSPTMFNLAVQRAGAIEGSVRVLAVVRTGIGTSPDSLTDAGGMREISLALIGARDTLYAESDANGGFRFNEVAGGTYTLKVLTESITGTRWEPSETEVSVVPGATRAVTFRQVPRRRAVQMMSGDVITTPPRQQQKQQQ